MVSVKRLGVLFLLLSLLIPTTVLPVSGDGDIPEIRPSALNGGSGPQGQEDFVGGGEIDWLTLWDVIVDALALLP